MMLNIIQSSFRKKFFIFVFINCLIASGTAKRVLNLKATNSLKDFDSYVNKKVHKKGNPSSDNSLNSNPLKYENNHRNQPRYFHSLDKRREGSKDEDNLPPFPFTEDLCLEDKGNNVLVAQMLLTRSPYVNVDELEVDSNYDKKTEEAVHAFQKGNDLIDVKAGCIDSVTASKLLALHSLDNYVNDKMPAKSYNYLYGNYTYKYKIDIEVYSNRSIESTAILYDDQNNNLYEFPVRLHGYRDDDISYDWPDWSSDYGLNQFTTDGATPTGLFEIDLNSPEPDPEEYGPYPVNRLVRGIDDKLKVHKNNKNLLNNNGAYLVPTVRSGILLHTGEWYKYTMNTTGGKWGPKEPMPNSAGCIHSHPTSIERIYKILTTKLNVKVNENPYSEGENYPYNPQGLLSITHIA